MRVISSQWLRAIGLAAVLIAAGLTASTARGDHLRGGVHVYGGWSGWDYSLRPQCVTGWYGPGWYNTGCYGGSGLYGGLGWGNRPYYAVSGTLATAPWGGVYATNYSSFGFSPWSPYWTPYYGYGSGYGYMGQSVVTTAQPVIVNSPKPAVRPSRLAAAPNPPAEPNMQDVLRQHAERRANVPAEISDANLIRPVSGSSRSSKDRSKLYQAEGDRWLRDGQLTKAYLRYLEAQREAEDRAEVYFRQAFTLVAMGRYTHAVTKFKRGLQVDAAIVRAGDNLESIYGPENVEAKSDYLQRVADWTNASVRDADRLFLMGIMLHFEGDSRATEFFQAAWKLSAQRDHLRAFVTAEEPQVAERTPPARVNDAVRAASPIAPNPATRRALPLPPPPQDDPVVEEVREVRVPRLPQLIAPSEPARPNLILPDLYLPEENR